MSVVLHFSFDNREAADHFKSWLCGSGEQQYWDWMGTREDEEPEGNITVLKFDYWGGNTISTRCGRLDSDGE